MPTTKEHAKKRKQTLIAKYGSWEAYKEVCRSWGSVGGKAEVPTKGFGYKKST